MAKLGSEKKPIIELDRLSNSVIDLIIAGKLDKAEDVYQQLLLRYPDQLEAKLATSTDGALDHATDSNAI